MLFGFSTGALAYGDFRRGLKLQEQPGIEAVELSALRESELAPLITAIPSLDLSQFRYKSFHAPSSLKTLNDATLVESLKPVVETGLPIIVHPDVIRDFKPWRSLGRFVLLENMDVRKACCRTVAEMLPYFQALPEAQFCFDIGHARQVDPTMSIATEFLLRFADRLAEIHISEVNWECRHVPISSAAAWAFHRISKLIPRETPVIIESVINEESINKELSKVQNSLNSQHAFNLQQCALPHAAY